jgi:transcriptional regulator with XRE-family HTH domain
VNAVNVSRARALGAELRQARVRKKLTLKQVGDELGRHHSDISRWETGKRLPSENDTSAVLAIYGVTGDDRARLLQLARDAADSNWVAPGVNKQLAALIEDERTARKIVMVTPLLIPGLLQTEDYARSIMHGAGTSAGLADQRVLVRLGRQAVLARRKPPEFLGIIGEHALRFPPCSNEIMAEQLHHLLEISERPHITILVLPIDIRAYTPAIEGSFVLFEFASGDPVVQQEHYRSTTTLTEVRDVRDYRTAVDEIAKVAMDPERSRAFIASLKNGMERSE